MSSLGFDNFLSDWKDSAERLREGRYRPVHGNVGKREFEVVKLSKYSEEIDGEKSLIATSLTEFSESPIYFARRVTYGAGARVVTKRDKKLFVIEQGPEAIDYLAAQDGISVKDLVRSCREADLGLAIARRSKSSEQKRRVELEVGVAARDERIADLNAEIALLTAERNHLARELAKRGAE